MKKGFTIVEILISLAVFSVLVYAGTTFFIQAVRDSAKTAIQNEVRQSAVQISEDIASEVQKIIGNRSGTNFCLKTASTLDTKKFYFYISDGLSSSDDCSAGATNRVVYVNDISDFLDTTSTTKRATLTKKMGASGNPSYELGSSKVSIIKCVSDSSCSTGLNVSVDSSNVVVVTISAQQNGNVTKSDFSSSIVLTKTITPRFRP